MDSKASTSLLCRYQRYDVRNLKKKRKEKNLNIASFKFSLKQASFKCEKVQFSTCINKKCLKQKCLVVPNNGFAL